MERQKQEVIEQLRNSRKYRDLCDETLGRIASWALAREPSVKAACKVAKRKLHQVYGAYAGQIDADRIQVLIHQLDLENLRSSCNEILACHMSTAERLPILEVLFDALWQVIGRPKSVMDLACGLNPFALPYMGLSDVGYYACDIDRSLVGCIGHFFDTTGVNGVAECRDLLVSVPDFEADVAFLFKTLPCLEQQKKDAGLSVLQAIRAPIIVVSFPTRSLGGHNRGMVAHYETLVKRLAERGSWGVEPLAFNEETFYILEVKS
jgi:16S rRNA (guanine(1405)-N(7))-methyltransferase